MATKKRRVRNYTVFFLPDRNAGGYTAHIPALGVVTEGETLAEAEEMAPDAIEGYIEAAEELGAATARAFRGDVGTPLRPEQ